MQRIIFNKGKHQRAVYYWLTNRDIYEGEYSLMYEICKHCGIQLNMQRFKEYFILKTPEPVPGIKCPVLWLENRKCDYSYKDIVKIIEENGGIKNA